MRNISIQLDDNLFKQFSILCAELGAQKKTIILNFIKDFLEEKEDEQLSKLAEKRMKEFKKKKLKTISHKDAWK
ncbi:MAG: hypothetical protein HY094_01695 [Candidatus Melainabacteria bacterium]|nr:hypothetical protein [Candidatus Melainabacteria bacterium]